MTEYAYLHYRRHSRKQLRGVFVVLQHFIHKDELGTINDVQEEDQRRPFEDCLEALFLRNIDESEDRFERIANFSFRTSQVVKEVLEVHGRAVERVVTLV